MDKLLATIIAGLLYVCAWQVWQIHTAPVVPAWKQPLMIDQKELDFLQEYHGTIALRIEGSRVSIWRDGKWLDITAWRERREHGKIQD